MDILLSFLADYGYLALFFLILIGGTYVPIPAGLILIVVGALSHHRMLHLIISFVIAVAASLTDDLIVYSIARRIGEKDVYERFIEKNRYARKFEGFTNRHPELAILSSRFIGVLAVPVNAFAGLGKLPLSTFIPLSLLGDSICVLIYLGVGYYLGAAWQTDAKLAGRVVSGIFVLLTLMLALGFYLAQRGDRKKKEDATAS